MSPVVFALTYGSVGDIIATIQILSNIAQTLCQTRESISRYEDLNSEINGLTKILLDLEGHQNSALNQEIERCKVMLKKFLDHLNGFKQLLDPLNIHSLWYKVFWAASEGQTVRQFREDLRFHMQKLSMFLLVTDRNDRKQLSAEIRSSFVLQSEHQKRLVDEIQALITTNGEDQKQLAEAVKNSMIRSSPDPHHIIDKYVMVIDALGEKLPIPTHFFSTWTGLQQILIGFFYNRPGEHLIRKGDYRLLHTKGNVMNAIDPTKLFKTVKEGMTVEMSVILRKTTYSPLALTTTTTTCPKCGRSKSTVEDGWAECSNCTAYFQSSKAEDNNELISPAVLDKYKKTSASGNQVHYRRMEILYQQESLEALVRDPESAIRRYTKSIDADPNDSMNWYMLGRAHMFGRNYENFEKSYEFYQQALYRVERNNTAASVVLWCSVGNLYFQINQYRDALDAYSRAVRQDPYNWELWFNLGVLYEACNNNQISDAIDAYGRAAELNPFNPEITRRLELLKVRETNGGEGEGFASDDHPVHFPIEPSFDSQMEGFIAGSQV